MDDADIAERFQSIGDAVVRRMFGGKGVYIDGRIVAVVFRDELWLKSDEQTRPIFEQAGSRRWTYIRNGRAPVAMPYNALPDSALDDPDIMADWARLALDAARRSEVAKTRRAGRPSA